MSRFAIGVTSGRALLALAGAFIALAGGMALPDSAVAAEDGTRIPIRGIIRPVRQASIATEAALRAISLPLRESARFRRGDTIVEFDCRRMRAELEAAVALQREAAVTLDSNVQLDRYQAVGKNDVGISRARADKAASDVAGMSARLDECRLVAPFDGRIAELSLHLWERTIPQRPFVTLVDDSALEIELIAPSALLPLLTTGARVSFAIDELGGRAVDANVITVGANVDAISKTVKVVCAIPTPGPDVLPGMSGTATLEQVPAQ